VGDFLPGSRRGVWGLLGILKCLGEEVPGPEGFGLSERRVEGLDTAKFNVIVFSGDSGG
jgi:hypothetical protein